MSDSRKETAVFRAIGYSRTDIAQIYLAYVFIFSVIVAILASLVVFFATIFAKNILEPQLSLYFTNFFMLTSRKSFTLLEFSPLVIFVFLPVFAVGVFASFVPILLNTRRSPLKNLRAE